MLGVRLGVEEEHLLERHARSVGRSKSAIVREWIKDRLERESIDAEMRRTSALLAEHDRKHGYPISAAQTDTFLRMLDELDGGYDWGPEGPPQGRQE